jgi:hypothetical protein
VPNVEELAYWQATKQLRPDIQQQVFRGENPPEVTPQIARMIHADSVTFVHVDAMLEALPRQLAQYCLPVSNDNTRRRVDAEIFRKA